MGIINFRTWCIGSSSFAWSRSILYLVLWLQEADLWGLHQLTPSALWFLGGLTDEHRQQEIRRRKERWRMLPSCQVTVWQWLHSSTKCHSSYGWTSPDTCKLLFPLPLRSRGPRIENSDLLLLGMEGEVYTIPCWFISTLPSPFIKLSPFTQL